MPMRSLHELMVEELQDILHAEQQLVKLLPKLVDASIHPTLRRAFETHLEETHGQVDRLGRVFEALGETLATKRCRSMEGLVAETNNLIGQLQSAAEGVRDAGLIGMAQKIEHYEIASYGTLIAYSQLMRHDEATALLRLTLAEEEAADRTLSYLAEAGINSMALSGSPELEL